MNKNRKVLINKTRTPNTNELDPPTEQADSALKNLEFRKKSLNENSNKSAIEITNSCSPKTRNGNVYLLLEALKLLRKLITNAPEFENATTIEQILFCVIGVSFFIVSAWSIKRKQFNTK